MYGITPTSVIALTVILTFFATVAVSLRLAQRKLRSLKPEPDSILLGWHLDDLLCFIALLLCYPSSAIIIWGAANGSVGGHSTPEDAENWIMSATPAWEYIAKVVWVCLWMQPLILGCVKLAALLLFRRIFKVFRSFNIVCWVSIGFVVAFMITFTIGLFFDCGSNIAANWGPLSEIAEECTFGFLPTVIYTIIDACFDLFILLLPIPWIFKLQMSLEKKLSVCGCFLLGGLATAAAFVRMAICIETGIPAAALNRQYVMGLPAWDILGIVSAEMFWHMVETTLAIVAVCLPAIRRLVSWTAFGKWLHLSSLGDMYHSMRHSAGSRSANHELESGSKFSRKISESSSREVLQGRESPYGEHTGMGLRLDGKTTTRVTSVKGLRDVEVEDRGIYRVDTVVCDLCKEKQYV